MVARSSVEFEFRPASQEICELIWLEILLDDSKVEGRSTKKLYCDNKYTINIAHNLYNMTRRNIEIDRHFIKEKLEK